MDNDKDTQASELDEYARALLARQSDAVARVAEARAEFERIRAELLRSKINIHHIIIGCW
jgi:hypothetical protein